MSELWRLGRSLGGLMLPESLIQLVGKPVPGIDRIVMTTRGGRRFRWLVVIEAIFVLSTVVLLLPIVLMAIVSLITGGGGGGGDGDGGGGRSRSSSTGSMYELAPGERNPIWAFYTSRFTLPTLDVRIDLQEAGGVPIWSETVEITQPAGYDVLLGSLLRIASLQQVPLEERFFVGPRVERIARFDATKPLCRDKVDALADIQSNLPDGCTLEEGDRSYTLTHIASERVSALRFVLMVIISPIAVFVVPRQVREVLVEGWRDLRRVAPRTTTLHVRPHVVHARVTRGRVVELDEVVRARAIQAFHMAPRITREPALVVYGPQVRILHEHGITRLPPGLSSENRSVERALSAALLDLWQRDPQAGAHDGPPPVRCRSCERSAPFKVGSNCPWCGGPLELHDVPAQA